MRRSIVFLYFIMSFAIFINAQIDSTHIDSNFTLYDLNNKTNNTKLSYGNKGIEFQYSDSYLMQVQWRFQFRFQTFSEDPNFIINNADDMDASFNLQRGRIKVGGYTYKPFIKYYLEFDFPSAYLLNWQFTIDKFKAFQIKLGQWKIKYNTERYISSGKQELIDRSTSNYYFTLDRQIGVMVKGELFEGKAISSSYNLGLFNGNGRMAQNNDGKFLLFARYQLNFSKKAIKMSYSDIERVQKLEGFIAFSYVRNQSAYTRFSSNGGGQLPGYSENKKLRYLINQYNFETMFKFKGLSLSSEYHIKNIDDKETNQLSQLSGGTVMAGYFFNELVNFIPKQLEMVIRYAQVSNNTFFDDDIYEYNIGLNWFFKGHLNKLTADFTFLENKDFVSANDNYRFRLQWDVSF